MSAWTIYWILQLDNLVDTLVGVTMLGGFSGVFMWGQGSIEGMAGMVRIGKRLTFVAAIAAVLCTFIPSTKTAAAMIVVPAITNNEALKAEAGDLYQLAKQALREAVTDKPEAK